MKAAWGIQNPDQECYAQDTRLTSTEKAIFQVSTKSNEKKSARASQKTPEQAQGHKCPEGKQVDSQIWEVHLPADLQLPERTG